MSADAAVAVTVEAPLSCESRHCSRRLLPLQRSQVGLNDRERAADRGHPFRDPPEVVRVAVHLDPPAQQTVHPKEHLRGSRTVPR